MKTFLILFGINYRRALTKGPGVLYKSCNKGGYFTRGVLWTEYYVSV